MILGLIPARGGSKGVPHKNIKLLGGHPLLAWSVIASRLSERIDKTVVTTESPIYGKIAERYGAEWLMRPMELATDEAGDEGYLKHAIGRYKPDLVVLLRPTTPLRKPMHIDLALKMMAAKFTSTRSAHIQSQPYQKCFEMREDCFKCISPYGNMPRQSLPITYCPNGYVDILKPDIVMDGKLYGDKIQPFISDNVGEVDCPQDFEYIEWRLNKHGSVIYDHLSNYGG